MDSHELMQSSRRWMQAGLEAFSREGDPHDFAVHHAAVGLEHLLKAYLSSLHPALIVDPKHLDSLLHAVGQSAYATTPVTRTKTIGLVEAFERVRRLLRPQISIDDKTFASVSSARNGVAHVGLHDDQEVRLVLTTCVRIAEPILAKLGATPESYWGEYLTLRNQFANEHATALRLAVETKLVRAKRAYAQRIEGLPVQQRITLITALSQARVSRAEYDHQVDCPACEGTGWLGGVKEVDWNQWLTNGPANAVPLASVMLYTTTYDCATCGLQLDDEELKLAGLPEEVELDEDVGDFYSDAYEYSPEDHLDDH